MNLHLRLRSRLAVSLFATSIMWGHWALATPVATSEVTGSRFTFNLEAPAPLDTFLRRHAELAQFESLSDLTMAELERLVAAAPHNVRQLLATQGYFSPIIDVRLQPATDLITEPLVSLQVNPGPPTRVASVTLTLQGPAQHDHQAQIQRIQWQRDWRLAEGQVFTQEAWEEAKTQALHTLQMKFYPQAHWTDTLADIDPNTHSAHLRLTLDSGPAYTFGSINIEGEQRYDEALATRLVQLAGARSGAPFETATLLAAQQRLVDSGYYESAFVRANTDGPSPEAPIEVRVREALRQKTVMGIGGSTDHGPRLSLEHTQHRVPGLDWRATTQLKLERDASTAATQWSSPVDERGRHWLASAQGQRVLDGSRTLTSQQIRVGQSKNDRTLDHSLLAQYDLARTRDSDLATSAETLAALSALYNWTQREFDTPPFPNRGHGLAVELGAGITLHQRHAPYLRTLARWQGYWPIAETSPRPSRLTLRLEGGAIWSQVGTPVPATQRFITGGDNLVRGYPLRSIGVPLASGGTEEGKLLTLASLEWQRPIWQDGIRTAWEQTWFIDSGAVANHAPDLRAHVGIGTGMRYNSPVGPLQMDLAYGLKIQRWRLHMRVGFAF